MVSGALAGVHEASDRLTTMTSARPPLRAEDLMPMAFEALAAAGEYPPTIIVEGAREVLGLVVRLPATAAERQRLYGRIGATVGFGLDARRALFVYDGYVRTSYGRPAPLPPSGSLADDAEARDAICISAWSRDGWEKTLIRPYSRRPTLEGVVIEPSPLDNEWDSSAGNVDPTLRFDTFAAFFEGVRKTERAFEKLDHLPLDKARRAALDFGAVLVAGIGDMEVLG